MASAGELRCVDSAIESVLEDIDSAFILKEEQRNAIKAFVHQKRCFCRPSYGIRKKLNLSAGPDELYDVALIGCRSIQLSEEAFFPGSLKHAP